jgi:hypothetical protein
MAFMKTRQKVEKGDRYVYWTGKRASRDRIIYDEK